MIVDEELIGQIIDIFEDNLEERADKVKHLKTASVELYFEDDDSCGVFFGGKEYDNIAEKLKGLLIVKQ